MTAARHSQTLRAFAEPAAEATATPIDGCPSLRKFVEQGYTQARPDLRPASLVQIYNSIDLLEIWAGAEVFCDRLNREFLLAFRAWRLEERPLPICQRHCYKMRPIRGTRYRCPQRDCPEKSIHVKQAKPATANKNVRTLVALWYEAIDQNFNSQSKQRIRPLKEDLDNLPCWEPQDVSAILKSCRQEPPELFLPCPTDCFWLALLLVVYDTGSRISAIMAATPADLDWTSGTLTLRAGTTKGHKCQVFGLSDQTLQALKAVHDPQRAYLFPWPYDRSQPGWRALTRRLKRILTRAGLPSSKIHLWHKVRRTTATELTIAQGLEAAKEHLGHSSDRVTKRYVDRRRLDQTKRNARLLPRPTL